MKTKPAFSITKINPLLKNIILLTFLVFIGLTLRLTGLNWDSGFYLHPDERFLAMVTIALKLPSNLLNYFNPATSTLNPYNNGFDFFVYGHFPLTLTKILAVIFDFNNYEKLYILGRTLSALFDTSTIIAVYFLAKTLLNHHKQNNSIAFYAALLYSLFVLPIQQSHFFTTDTFLVAMFTWSLYFALKNNVFFTALFLSLALATKISIIFALPLIILLFVLNAKNKKINVIFLRLAILTLLSYSFLRLFDPYIFEYANFFNLTLSTKFITSLKTLQTLSNSSTFFPPNLQWLNKGFFFPLKNIFFFGLGPAFFLLALYGAIYLVSIVNLKKVFKQKRHMLIIVTIGWLLFFSIYQSSQIAKTMRYFYMLYPLFALFAGFALSTIKFKWLKVSLYFLGIFWTLMFMNIYLKPHTRVQASRWLYNNATNHSKFIVEYWDDPLPLTINNQKQFELITVDFYQKDNKEKWTKIANTLLKTDYIVLSSNRLWAVIPQFPQLFPITSRYYSLLLNEKLGFNIMARYTSFPGIRFGNFSIRIPDTAAEEAFTVYDHPEVIILKKDSNFSKNKFLDLLYANK